MTTFNQRSLAAAIATIHARWPDLKQATSPECPVFVLAAGWRSGSTLLQRMLMPECFIWGEPYGHSGMLPQLADPLRCMSQEWPEPHFFFHVDNRGSKVAVTLRRDEPAARDVAPRADAAMPQESEAEGGGAEVKQEVDGSLRVGGDAARLITTERDGYIAERDALSERFAQISIRVSRRCSMHTVRIWRRCSPHRRGKRRRSGGDSRKCGCRPIMRTI